MVVHTVAVTLSQSVTKARNPSPNKVPAVLHGGGGWGRKSHDFLEVITGLEKVKEKKLVKSFRSDQSTKVGVLKADDEEVRGPLTTSNFLV